METTSKSGIGYHPQSEGHVCYPLFRLSINSSFSLKSPAEVLYETSKLPNHLWTNLIAFIANNLHCNPFNQSFLPNHIVNFWCGSSLFLRLLILLHTLEIVSL